VLEIKRKGLGELIQDSKDLEQRLVVPPFYFVIKKIIDYLSKKKLEIKWGAMLVSGANRNGGPEIHNAKTALSEILVL
jgi:hypothetical protein